MQLSEELLAKLGGWEVLKQARGVVAAGKVLSAEWNEPMLKGSVQEGGTVFKCGLILKGTIDTENLCSCRASRSWGTICAHSVAVGLQVIKPVVKRDLGREGTGIGGTEKKVPKIEQSGLKRSPEGERVELHVIFPPTIEQALARGKLMMVLEADWQRGRTPLNVLPKGGIYAFDEVDGKLMDVVEGLSGGELPAMLMLGGEQLTEVLAALTGHPRVTLGKQQPILVESVPMGLEIMARLDADGAILLAAKGK
ncbi:MAG: hypothetical protein SFY81_14560, partial [Verrucomicrobiota bacterium]|nr:hypothetical protein [Verrucomicrobiota bacterium]